MLAPGYLNRLGTARTAALCQCAGASAAKDRPTKRKSIELNLIALSPRPCVGNEFTEAFYCVVFEDRMLRWACRSRSSSCCCLGYSLIINCRFYRSRYYRHTGCFEPNVWIYTHLFASSLPFRVDQAVHTTRADAFNSLFPRQWCGIYISE